ncbi:unnamed protein product [Heligmosomoides polygyrus]|uniref:Reverse transcriptase domain-containing protein n=1 Tax=Heligmosomoides polygyrus TaxID=6339 RepID=A0A183FK42_HELPZ|nr:unnamed protein product [Heligmosomoides polygyrus]
MFGLKLNVKKSEYLTTDVNEAGSIEINGTALVRWTHFKYLGFAVASDSSLTFEVNLREDTERLKSKIYRTIVRPVAMYGAECWSATKEVETRLSVMETKMLRWTAGVTRLDRICNDEIRQRFGVAPIADKLREARLRLYDDVVRANDDTVRKTGLNTDVPGKRP